MSGQWEVVNRTKKKQNGQPPKKLSKSEQQKVIERAPKVEDVLPLHQVQTLFDVLDKDDKENKKPGKENLKKDSSKKLQKSQKKQSQQQVKKKETGKEKPATPKTLEAAVKLINIKELTSELEMGQARFPNAPLVWLKGFVVYLNTKLTVESIHPIFSGKPHHYPKSILPSDLQDLLNQIVEVMDFGAAQALFEWGLTAMANDMSRGSKAHGAVVGYKIMLQTIARCSPPIALAAVPKVNALEASYQNQQPIGLSLLWAVGQGGYQDLGIALQVWQSAMVPMMELRHYTAFTISYLNTVLASSPPATHISEAQLMPTLTFLCTLPTSTPTARRKEMQEIIPPLLRFVRELPCEDGLRALFPALLQLLAGVSSPSIQNQFLVTLERAVTHDEHTGAAWVQLYKTLLAPSKLLVEHLVSNWAKMPKRSQGNVKKVLKGIEAINSSLEKQGSKDPNFRDCQRLSVELRGKMATARAFPWRRANLVLLAAIAALVLYDVRQHRHFRASSTGRLLRDVGALPYVEGAWARGQAASVRSYRWLEANAPQYYYSAWEASRPYVLSAQELVLAGAQHAVAGCQAAYQYIQEKAPLVAEKVEEWAPGLRERSVEFGAYVWEQTKVYSVAGGKALIGYGEDAVSWARTNVFVGSWSPDNLHQYSMAVLNATQQYAVGTYDWLYQKVQTLSKVP